MQDWIFEQADHDRGPSVAKGFKTAGISCGIKPSGKLDLAALVADCPCNAAAVFTQNQIPGAPVTIGKRHIADGRLQAIIINSGISNVATGQAGLDNAITMCRVAAENLNIDANLVLPSSTGVIGVPLPMQKITPGIVELLTQLDTGQTADHAASDAILTTDTRRKLAAISFELQGQPVHLGAMCKGSGMIAPNMATMLCYITTDAAIAPGLLQQALTHAVNQSFNRITIDSDTSTSDTVALLASGLANHTPIDQLNDDFKLFQAMLTQLCRYLAWQVIVDGEGVTRLMRLLVHGAATQADAEAVARTLANSPLIKCALHGSDPNWGRLVMALGRSSAAFDPQRFSIIIGDITVGRDGHLQTLTADQQQRLNQTMQQPEVTFTIDLNTGDFQTDWLGCDLTNEYVRINAEYTT